MSLATEILISALLLAVIIAIAIAIAIEPVYRQLLHSNPNPNDSDTDDTDDSGYDDDLPDFRTYAGKDNTPPPTPEYVAVHALFVPRLPIHHWETGYEYCQDCAHLSQSRFKAHEMIDQDQGHRHRSRLVRNWEELLMFRCPKCGMQILGRTKWLEHREECY